MRSHVRMHRKVRIIACYWGDTHTRHMYCVVHVHSRTQGARICELRDVSRISYEAAAVHPRRAPPPPELLFISRKLNWPPKVRLLHMCFTLCMVLGVRGWCAQPHKHGTLRHLLCHAGHPRPVARPPAAYTEGGCTYLRFLMLDGCNAVRWRDAMLTELL